MPKFRVKEVEAVQFTKAMWEGDESLPAGIGRMLEGIKMPGGGDSKDLPICKDDGRLVQVGDYIVRGQDKSHIFTKDRFEALYEEIDHVLDPAPIFAPLE